MQRYALLFGLATIGGTLLNSVGYFGLLLVLCVSSFLWVLWRRFGRHSTVSAPAPASVLVLLILGLSWGHGWVFWQLQHRLPSSLDKTDVRLEMVVRDVSPGERWQRLTVKVLPGSEQGEGGIPPLRQLMLNYYQTEPELQVGDRLMADVRVKAIRGFSNGLAFDYEAWMLRQNMDARGYIRHLVHRTPALAGEDDRPLREGWLRQQQLAVSDAAWPWVAGLVFGEQGAFTPDQWQLTQQTGTLHLLVVSGLHMGMLSGLVVVFVSLCQRLLAVFSGVTGFLFFRFRVSSPLWVARLSIHKGLDDGRSALRVKAALVMLSGAGYLYLAGAGVALQRSFIMLVALVLIVLFARRLSPMAGLSYAFAVILAVSPLIYTGAGFGFSMVAVGGLLAVMSGRKTTWVTLLWLPQWVVFVCLLPVMLWWGQSVSLVSLLCNAIAIPLVGMLLLPLALLTAVFPGMWWESALIELGAIFWQFLQYSVALPAPVLRWQPVELLLVWACLLVLLNMGARPVVGGLAMLAALVLMFSGPAPTADRVVLLDVGQGQALVVTAREPHTRDASTMVIDTGPRFSDRFDAGKAMVAPVLRRLGVTSIDHLVISHSDLDHSGGWNGLLGAGMAVQQQWYGQAGVVDRVIPEAANRVLGCHQSDNWVREHERFSFRFLTILESHRKADNDASCVVQFRWHGRVWLIPGDIGKRAERALVSRYGKSLTSDVLVAAHHGSRSSSSRVFLNAVDASEIWISAGFNNRFGHPHHDVLDRMAAKGSVVRITAIEGAVGMATNGQVTMARHGWAPPWRQQ